MVTLIIGHKGSGKTKKLIQAVNDAIEKSNGNVICVEQALQKDDNLLKAQMMVSIFLTNKVL